MLYADFKIALWIGFVALSIQCMMSGDLLAIPVAFVFALIVHLMMDLLFHGIARRMMRSEKKGNHHFTMQQAKDIQHKASRAASKPVITESERHSLLLRTDPNYLWSLGDEKTPGSMAYRNRMKNLERQQPSEKRKSRQIDV